MIYAPLGAGIGGVVIVALVEHQFYGKPAYIYQNLGIKQPCSVLKLQVPTRLLDDQYIFKSH